MLHKTHDAAITGGHQADHPTARSDRHHLGDLRTPGLLGQYPIIGVLMVVFGMALFSVMAINLESSGPLLQTDTQIVNDLHAQALQSGPAMRTLQDAGFYLGEYVIIAIGALLALYFAYKRFWPELSMVLIGWLGEGGIWLILSQAFNRTRPVFAVMLWKQTPGPGFPSGHSFSAVLCYGLLAYLLVPKMPSRFWKGIVVLVALLITLFIGFSRVYMGDHYPTDVLAGYGLGIAWSAFVYTGVELLSQRRVKAQ